MSDENKVYPVPAGFAAKANLTPETYREMYAASIADPERFWGEQGKRLDWMTDYTVVKDVSWDKSDLHVKWYSDGVLNVTENCLDRHLETRGDKPAIIWEGDDPSESKTLTYRELHGEVCRFANVMKKRTKRVPLKANCDAACDIAKKDGKSIVNTVLTVRRTGGDVTMTEGRDVWLHEALEGISSDCPPEPMNAEDPLFILYTSGSTGKPKGVLHTTGGYLVWASMTHEYVFDLKEDDVYWCSADVGWVTGHTYIVYGPLANGATTVMFEGIPTYPDASRFWQVCDKHKVSLFYTAPTAIRALMREGDGPVNATSRKSLRILGTVVGEGRCPIVDTWWQTETGGAMIVPLPGASDMKPGAGSHPFFGIVPALVDAEGHELDGATDGNLIIKESWPGQMRTVYGDFHRRWMPPRLRWLLLDYGPC